MNKLTNQSAFTKAAEGLLDQMAQSRAWSGVCKYRTFKDGKLLCCGVGFLVSDELASLMDIGDDSSVTYVVKLEEVYEVLGHLNMELLVAIQAIHDKLSPEAWEESLKRVAEDFNLIWEL
tara:strand:- start:784 stop:1143 length:360 start_codon:yes stop_codon:yes gene_type:complete